MDQQQLQIARTALWHQTAKSDPSAPLRTFDAAAQWLDDIGICLFLPRHTQLPVPAPSFAEACLGAASITPPPAAVAEATELLTRLVGERRIIPLNLLGTFSEQPDYLITTEVLPWVAAVRGDRQWKAAPGGRTSPIVLRTFEALDREGELTSSELREILGREITEAAALRALMELWTGLRAMPIAAPPEPTRWTLLKNRFPAQLTTAANTAQTTALSALLSLYLHSAVAATAEEAEIFLSPLTARSRIREVLHGMTATRQFGTTTVASHTVLFIEGSLPETEPAPEAETPAPISAPPRSAAPSKAPARKGPRPTRWELPSRQTRPASGPSRPWQKKPAAAHRPSSRPQAASDRPRGEEARPPQGSRPGFKRAFGQRPGGTGPRRGSSDDKPWQRRKSSFPPKPLRNLEARPENREASPTPANRSGDRPRPASRRPGSPDRQSQKPRWRDRSARPAPFGRSRQADGERPSRTPDRRPPQFRKDRAARPAPFGKNRKADGERPNRAPDRRPPQFGKDRAARPAPFGKNRRAEGERPNRAPDRRPPQFSKDRAARPAPFGKNRRAEGERAKRDQGRRPPQFRSDRRSDDRAREPSQGRRPWRDRPAPRGDRPAGASSSGQARPDRPSRPFRPGKPSAARPSRAGSPGDRPRRFGPSKNKFRKSPPAERKPRKNRSQEEAPE